ncbi:ParB/RepB/Spo0J family partition protein [Saccharopolyspora gloriosae]|uniref:ParB/RepB/Spo0J family partition protein n=1 Tax=Saccharopolyspora gloriosae TaxID=455344 RepID=UPI001FB70398|nr:ParB/RepB/Spo0J family partition protein [Saccharopolyspora gloriosae]
MTIATTDEDQTDTEIIADKAHDSEVRLLWVDPNELIIGINVRKKATLRPGFVADIKRRGVTEPVTLVPCSDGTLVVRKGQRRVLAAIKAGRTRVPALLVGDAAEEPEPKAQVARLIDQLGENEHRAGITDGEELAATQQLLDLGLSARQIARERSIPRTRVESTVVVARSATARNAVLDDGLDLLHAAVLAEFEGDDEAMSELLTTATDQPLRLGHVAQRWRDQREEEAALAARTAELTEQGLTVIDRPYVYPDGLRRLSALRPTPQAEPGIQMRTADHLDCPGHAVFLDYSRCTGEIEEIGVCTDFPTHRHAERLAPEGQSTCDKGPAGEPMSEQDREAKKAYRRTVIGNGKAWDSATTLRKDWLRQFAAKRTAPKDAPVWAARTWASGVHCLRKALESGHALAADLLGITGGPSELVRAAEEATPSRATVITTVLALAAIETSTDRRHTWEHPDDLQRGYFAQIQQWGYEPSEVEALVTADDQPAQ